MARRTILPGLLPRSVTIAGTGRAARFLVRLCRRAAIPDVALWGRRSAAALALAAEYGVRAVDGPVLRQDGADVVVLAVADGAVAEVAAAAAAAGGGWTGTTVVHCSGVLDEGPLAPLAACGAAVVALHPLMTLYPDCPLEGVTFVATGGEGRAEAVLRPLVEGTGNRWYRLAAEQRPAYHAAATVLCQGVAAAVETARQLAGGAGMVGDDFVRAFGPLAAATVAARMPATAAPTGPATRGDEATSRAHRAVVAGRCGSAAVDFYDGAAAVVRACTGGRA